MNHTWIILAKRRAGLSAGISDLLRPQAMKSDGTRGAFRWHALLAVLACFSIAGCVAYPVGPYPVAPAPVYYQPYYAAPYAYWPHYYYGPRFYGPHSYYGPHYGCRGRCW
ncbi:MAG TPA: hypothetical protein VM639_10505 [Dongiaceae bacterium]|nr:hypothetical protein [Dongiaceae bacterium]